MSFLHHSSYPYGGHAGIPMDHGPPIAHPAIANVMDGYLLTHGPYDMTDYYPHMPMMEDLEEYPENLSRPRLTKEQVDTLEAQFQAHPKPNSNVKRELAFRTNLSLPRVANWFQNRRAKAKQQKRLEEYERMQREAKEKDDQTKSKDEESTDVKSERGQKSPSRRNDGNTSPNRKSLTPTQAAGHSNDRPQTSSSSSVPRHKIHQKTGSDATRERTFASLQRALNAAVAARDQHTRASEGSISTGTVDMGYDVRQTNIPVPSANNTPQTSLSSAYSEWGSSRDSSIAWTPSQSPEDGYEFGSLNAVPYASEDQLAVGPLDNSPNADIAGSHGFRPQQLWGTQLQGRQDARPSESMYGSLQFSSLQPPSASSSRRPSSSEDLTETINGIGIHTAPLTNSMEGPMWRRPEKELDLAARRKRPRPAAIGTTAHHRIVAGQSAVSPSTRLTSFGTPHHTIRHAKSSHTLGSRYAGVRKFSTPQRSPLGFASFAEAGAAGSEHKQKHRLHSSASVGNLAPPTPLTPEDLQHMLPTTTSDSQLSLASQRLTDSQSLFPVTQPMQINVASPPETPLTMDMFGTIQYQGLAPPFSAPPQYASFTEYSPISSEPLTAVSWAVSTPDTSVFPTSLQSQQQQQQQPPNYIYEHEDDEQQESTWTLSEEGSSLYGSTKGSATPPANTMTASEEQDQNMTQFHIHEFPKQQEAHRNVAQQLAPQIPKNYTFSNQTPSDF